MNGQNHGNTNSAGIAAPLAIFSRRTALTRLAAGAVLFSASGAFAEELTRTPRQTEGPFYPDKLPLDTDNDLLIVNNGTTSAVGEVTHLSGKVLDSRGDPVRNALVEIWQCDSNGVYIHTRDASQKSEQRDRNFQGFGRFLTDRNGAYYFRTIKPVAYPGRTPHIHFKIKSKGKELLTTQCYIRGNPQNQRDGVWRGIATDAQRDSVSVAFDPIKESRIGELTASFNIVLGFTPEA